MGIRSPIIQNGKPSSSCAIQGVCLLKIMNEGGKRRRGRKRKAKI
jgi:hypothetical protein